MNGKMTSPGGRLLSLDVFRGMTMFLLMAESAEVYYSLNNYASTGSALDIVVRQFHHHPWNGLRFWDLIQPFFMFIVGVAMPFSFKKRVESGEKWSETFIHILFRCFILFALGIVLHCGYSKEMVWELWNVLTQLSFTILIAFLVYKLPVSKQLAISVGLLILTELLYRLWPVAGYDQPFVKDRNFGSWMDMLLMGKINSGGGWVAINSLPAAAHTVWGLMAGGILIRVNTEKEKMKILLLSGVAGLLIGYSLDWFGITPIIKRICTSSFVFVSGGWCFIILAFLYWLVDIKGVRAWAFFAVIVGMNSIFIYMFGQTIGAQWVNDFIRIFSEEILSWFHLDGEPVRIINALTVLGLE